jgi:hypothetical protein
VFDSKILSKIDIAIGSNPARCQTIDYLEIGWILGDYQKEFVRYMSIGVNFEGSAIKGSCRQLVFIIH